MATCYRHPKRETGVSCSNCGNPICPECMTPTPVGMRCPNCSKQRTQTRALQSMAVEPIATYVLIAINVAIYVAVQNSARAYTDLVLFGPAVADGDFYRLLTSGFLHTQIWHIGMNMLSLFWLGRMVEPAEIAVDVEGVGPHEAAVAPHLDRIPHGAALHDLAACQPAEHQDFARHRARVAGEIEPRPYMNPALAAAEARLPEFFKDTI